MKTPVVAINFKTYASSVGTSAHMLAKICDEVATNTQKNIIVCVSAPNIHISKDISIPVFAQHVDGTDFGAHTGKLLAVDLQQNGASGSVINHSENQIPIEDIQKAIASCKQTNITSLVCADSLQKAQEIAKLQPDCIAFEPPELIGGDISVTTRPDIIIQVRDAIKNINPDIKILIGAGVKTKEDVQKAIELETDGVLLASGITKADKPNEVLENLVNGI